MIAESLLCLALNVYYEARGENLTGQMAVALVTLNRAKEQKKEICTVVYAPHQFSWTAKAQEPPKHSDPVWNQVLEVAKTSFTYSDFTDGATFFHSAKIAPRWALAFTFVARYGNHYFYRR